MRTNNSILPLLKFALAALVLGVAVAAQQKPVALRGGKLLTVTHGTIENGVLIIENGKIAAVGAPASVKIPQDARLIDVSGMTVYPGLIDSETQLGLTEIPAEEMTNDFIELSDEIMPHMHVYDAFHAESELIPVTRYNGVTNAIVAPGNLDTLPGQDSFVQLAGKTQGDFLLVRDIAMPLNFSGEQRRNQGPFDRRKFPSTRMGLAAQLRQVFLDAQDYGQKWTDYEKRKQNTRRTKATKPRRIGPLSQTIKIKRRSNLPRRPSAISSSKHYYPTCRARSRLSWGPSKPTICKPRSDWRMNSV